jgi:peptide/nickel transport system substrate-binding protein/oligopeptide transport system substrate-binding protein
VIGRASARIFALAVLAAAGAAGGCAEKAVDSRMLELALETAPNRLDPAFAVDVAEGEICSLVYEGLVGFDPAGRMVAGIARRWEIEDGGRRYVFHLDPRGSFAGGRPVRARDVVASFERVLSPATASPRAWVLARIAGADAFQRGEAATVAGLAVADDTTLVISLDEPFAPFLSMLALPAARVVDTASVTEGQLPAGSGPWMVAEYVRGDRVTLVPNPRHPRAARGIEGIRYRVIPEPFTRVAEFESGTIDILEVPDAEVARYRDDPATAARVQKRSELRIFYVGLNNARFSDPRVRRALNHAVNVPALVRVLASGEAVIAHGSVPPALPGHRERPGYAYDPARARALLAEAGYADGLSLEIWQRESAEGNRVLEAVQGYLLQAGVKATLVRREWSAFKEAVSAGKVDAFLLDWVADYPDAENFLYPLFHSSNHGGGGNRSFFTDPVVDSLLVAASRDPDAAARSTRYAHIDSLVHAQAPWIYLYFPTSFHVVSDRISGYRLPAIYLGNDFHDVRKQPR